MENRRLCHLIFILVCELLQEPCIDGLMHGDLLVAVDVDLREPAELVLWSLVAGLSAAATFTETVPLSDCGSAGGVYAHVVSRRFGIKLCFICLSKSG